MSGPTDRKPPETTLRSALGRLVPFRADAKTRAGTPAPPRSWLYRYGLALVLTAAAFVLSLILRDFLRQHVFLFFLAAVTLSAWRAGFWPSIVASVLSVLGANYLFFAPVGELSLDYAHTVVSLAVFFLLAAVIASSAARMRIAVEKAERRAATEERLRAQLETALHDLPVGVWLIDEVGRAIYGNPAGQRIWRGAELAGAEFVERYRAWRLDTGEPVAPADRPVARVLRTREPVLDEELEIEASDGTRKILSVSAVPIFGADGEFYGVVVLDEDITERKRNEEEREVLVAELEFERARLAHLFELAPAFMAVLRGPEHVFELVNPSYLRLVGHRDIVGKPVREALPELAGQGYFELLDRVFQTGEPYLGKESVVRLRRTPGAPLEVFFFDFVYQPLFSTAGAVTGIFVHGVDVTDLVRARRDAEAANAAKSQFLAVMSHELRTPLNAILGFSDLLEAEIVGPLNPAQKDEVARIRGSGRHLLSLIEQILTLSRVEAGREPVEVRRFDLVALADEAASTVRPLAAEKRLALHVQLPADRLEMESDPGKVRQILLNLLGNAIKFTERGRVGLVVRADDDVAVIEVSDTGPGIPPEDRERVFEPFMQAEVGATRTKGGAGLGLGVSRRLARLLGGDIALESRIGEGSTFTVRLPRRMPEAETTTEGAPTRETR